MITVRELQQVLQEIAEAFGPDVPVTIGGPDAERPRPRPYADVAQVCCLFGSRDRTHLERLVVLYATGVLPPEERP